MPYGNGPVHIGHLAGTQVPADIYARYLRMLIGNENVLYVNGSDDHGSTSELAALQAGKSIPNHLSAIHARQKRTLDRFDISVDIYTGTSRAECFPIHGPLSQDFIRKLHKNGMLEKRTTQQWFDPSLGRFLQDRFVRGRCPNPKCENTGAYSDECDACGSKYDPTELLNPKSALSEATPELRDTVHWWLDMWKVSEPLRKWIQSKEKTWRQNVFTEVLNTVLPALSFDNTHEPKYKEIKAELPKHKSKYAPGKKVQAQFESKDDLLIARGQLESHGIPSELLDGWAHRSISRDVAWGIPMPKDLDPEMEGKTLYVWPDSLIAPISFTQVALKAQGRDPATAEDFWKNPESKVFQFLGQDNVYFYVLMQGAMWLGTQKDPQQLPQPGDLQLTEILGCFHLLMDGEKMSKSKGNFYTDEHLLDEMGFTSDQIRYYLSLLSLPDKPSSFDMPVLKERNRFLAGPMNAAFEKPLAACHSKFGGRVPDGKLMEKVEQETTRLVGRYFKAMEKADYPVLLGAIENYARQINSLFTQFKPHDDRFPEQERRDALYSCFYVLKNLMIMLYPFVPSTMEKLRESLKLAPSTFRIEELGTGIPAGHEIGEKQQFFPAVEGATGE
jgi:methionyl-tRNA synthetase